MENKEYQMIFDYLSKGIFPSDISDKNGRTNFLKKIKKFHIFDRKILMIIWNGVQKIVPKQSELNSILENILFQNPSMSFSEFQKSFKDKYYFKNIDITIKNLFKERKSFIPSPTNNPPNKKLLKPLCR